MKNTTVLVAIKHEQTRSHFLKLLSDILSRTDSRASGILTHEIDSSQFALGEPEILQSVWAFAEQNKKNFTVLLADWLIDPARRKPTSTAVICITRCREIPFGTIGIAPQSHRTSDIDRTLRPICRTSELESALELVTKRLEYLLTPEKRKDIDRGLVEVRFIKNTETEFSRYFSLRQQVYKIMGYLDEKVENGRSQLEINEADTHSIHVGAFYREISKESMVGTARVVMNGETDAGLKRMFLGMASRDVVLKKLIDTPYGLGLPIFQSQSGMNKIMSEILRNNIPCGELSRVTVSKEFRGVGISRRLVDFAIQKAIAKGAQRLFLECLETHEALYVPHGFRKLTGVSGPVVDVGRTMIGMELTPQALEQVRSSLKPARSNTSFFSRSDRAPLRPN